MTAEQITRDRALDSLAEVLAAIARIARIYEGDVPLPDRIEVTRDDDVGGIAWPVRVVYDRPSGADLDELVARYGPPRVEAQTAPGVQTWMWGGGVAIRAIVIRAEAAS